ncbi:unnamed protein product [Victoria cruziana]
MVDLDWKSNVIVSGMRSMAPDLAGKTSSSDGVFPFAGDMHEADELPQPSPADVASYENYLRLPELSRLWGSKEWQAWKNETLLRPSLQGLEITFRLISIVLSDLRPYSNKPEWRRRLESLADRQVELIAAFCKQEGEQTSPLAAPTFDRVSEGVLQRDGSSPEVWKVRGSSLPVLVNRVSEQSLLPRLRTWKKAEDTAAKIALSIECHMQSSPFTLGLGEPNLSCKRTLCYDLVCRPSDLYALKNNPFDRRIDNAENQTLYTVHQILEAWIFVARQLIRRISGRIDDEEWGKAADDCWLLERVWKLLEEIQELHLLMDPDDFLRLKSQLYIGGSTESGGFCLRSLSLYAATQGCKELKNRVPAILGAEADPRGGPRIQEAAMRLFHRHGGGRGPERIHLLQAFQAVETAVKRFYFGYHQVVVVVMGSLEAKGNHSLTAACPGTLSQTFLEPPYFPSLDAAKTFLGDFWRYESDQGGRL